MGNIKDYLVYFWKGTDKLLLFLCLLASSFSRKAGTYGVHWASY